MKITFSVMTLAAERVALQNFQKKKVHESTVKLEHLSLWNLVKVTQSTL